ncbi:MAG: flagellar basal body rod protein FlgB, partial [Burkholderiaceae bacterium]|nr:flagellar basal body rod protein FlgB [Burkholderiaceae bacterium]
STLSFARFVVPTQSSLDGNTVDMDRERSAFAQNAIMYQFALNSLDDEWKEFKMASSDPRR